MTTPSASEPTTPVLLTILESALLKLLERGMHEAAEESVRRVMAGRGPGNSSHGQEALSPSGPRATGVVVPFRRPVVSGCPND